MFATSLKTSCVRGEEGLEYKALGTLAFQLFII